MENYLFSKKFFLKPYLKNITQNEGDGFSSLQLQWLLSSFKLVCISEVASPSSFNVSFLSKVKMNSTNRPSPNDEVPHNSVGRALPFFVILILQRPWVPFESHWKSPVSIIGGRGCLICYLLKILKRTVTIIPSCNFCISAAQITLPSLYRSSSSSSSSPLPLLLLLLLYTHYLLRTYISCSL